VIDARATMAIYRLHRGQWEKGYAAVPTRVRKVKAKAQPKASRQQTSVGAEGVRTESSPPSKMKSKGVSSGLSTIVHRRAKDKGGMGGAKVKWWTELGGNGDGSKGHISVTT
jgi:RNA exonuclease 4